MIGDLSLGTLRRPVLALDLGGTNARAAVVTPDGRLSSRHAGPAPMSEGANGVVAYCASLLKLARDEHLAAGGDVPIAVGVCAPGPLDAASGTLIDPPNLRGDWWGFPLAPAIGDALGLPWALERDTVASILGEWRFGAGRGLRDIVYLTISTGVGGSVISDGRPLLGPDGVAGELGHLTVDMNGPICSCGAPGHLESFASGEGIARAAREALDSGADAPHLARLAAEAAPAPVSAVEVTRAEALGDVVAGVILAKARRAVAVSVVSIVDVFGPDVIILGGGIALAWGERLLAPAQEAVEKMAFRIQAARARVVAAALGEDVGLIGAVPLIATALPGLVHDEGGHDVAAADRADVIT